MIKSKLIRNMNYYYFNNRYESFWTLRLKFLYFSLHRNKATKTWHHRVKFINDLDILGLYHEIDWNTKTKTQNAR